jgi:uncharacterized membrane protein YphA (DoxX/SURF4 family)
MALATKNIISWVLRSLAAIIMLQTLYFKFSGAPESVYIFSSLGIGPWGRIGTGIMELIASVLILLPRTTAIGALLALGIMGGAILSHFFVLGISVQNDGGQLFLYAVLVFISAAILLFWYWRQMLRFVPTRFRPVNLF